MSGHRHRPSARTKDLSNMQNPGARRQGFVLISDYDASRRRDGCHATITMPKVPIPDRAAGYAVPVQLLAYHVAWPRAPMSTNRVPGKVGDVEWSATRHCRMNWRTKCNCILATGPDDIREEARIPTTTPAETMPRSPMCWSRCRAMTRWVSPVLAPSRSIARH